MARRIPVGTWEMCQVVRIAVEEMHKEAEKGGPQAHLLDAVADLLTFEADTRHVLIADARRGILGGTAEMCACGSHSTRYGGVSQPCGRVQRAHEVAVAYLGDPDLETKLLRFQRDGRPGGRRRAR